MRCDVVLLFFSSLGSAKLLERPFEGVVSLTIVQVYAVLLPMYFYKPLSTQNLLDVQQ